jgi:sterol desaturase/sphingolipid hydroxylase (fatty acid hydroxylase superfamily)
MELLANLLSIKSALLAVLLLVPLQLALPMHSQQKILRPRWGTDVIYLLINGIPIKLGVAAIIVLTLSASEHAIPAELRASVASQPLWLQLIELIVVADLVFYVVHRLFHTVPILWRFHAVHHSIKELDWLAAHRIHPFDQILTKGASLVPAFALGISDWAIAAGAILFHWHTLLLHSNVRLRLGPLRWLVASPEFHHWHHSDHCDAWNRNFAAQLPLWDLLFRTAYMPKGQGPCRYGIDDPVPLGYLQQLSYPFHCAEQSSASPADQQT